MKITKTKRMLSILLTFMMMVSVFSILSVTSASADDMPEQVYVTIKPNITWEESFSGGKSFSVTASVEDRSYDYVGISSPTITKYESYEDPDDLLAWHHIYKVTFRLYVRSSSQDISTIKYIYVKDGKCSYYASLTKGSAETGFYQSGNYLIANIICIPFEVYTYKNNQWIDDRFWGIEKARYWCPFQMEGYHPTGYGLAATFYDDASSQVRKYNGEYTLEPTVSGFYYSVPRNKSYTGRFAYTNGYGGVEETSKNINSTTLRKRFSVVMRAEKCTEGPSFITKMATCTSAGTSTTSCTVCGKTLKTETIAALGHKYSVLQSTTPATCTTGTKKVYKCSRCSATIIMTSNDALGHDYSVLQSQTPATCTTGTKSVYKCSRCSATKTVTADDALGHNYVYDSERSTPATVYEEGQEVYHCTRCDVHYVAENIPKKTEDSGFLQGGCAYQFDANTGTLTISPVFGKTSTGDYVVNDGSLPWNNTTYKKMITKLVIGDGMTEIGNNVFSGTAVTEVTTPSTMTRIGHSAFAYCNNLKSITVNGTDCVIDSYAFDSCEGQTLDFITLNGVKSVDLSAFHEVDSYKLNLGNIETINKAAFAFNKALTEVTVPASCKTLDTAFGGCDSVEKFTVLNPDCEIISEDWGIPYLATIYCYTNSTAHQFALDNDRTFKLLDAIPEVESVDLNKHTLTLGVGQAYTLKPIVTPDGAETTFKWKSSKKDIATVTSLGKVTGRAVGKATITVTTENGKTCTCTVVVKPAPTSITLNKTEMTLGVGQMYTLQTTMTPDNAATYQQWTSSDKTIAVVNDKGRVTGKKVGTATITVKTTNGLTATCTVTVKKAPTSVAINKTTTTLAVGQKETLTATLTPTDSATYCSWSSSDDTIATVSSSGVVTGKKVGTATITVKTTNDKTATCTVTVKKAPTAVTLDKTELTLKVGETYTLKKTLTPSNAYTTYTYSSSKTAVATVTASGKIVAKKAGTTVITVTTHNGKTATCTVTVK